MGNYLTVTVPSFDGQVNMEYSTNFWGAFGIRKHPGDPKLVDVFCVDRRAPTVVHTYLLSHQYGNFTIINYTVSNYSRSMATEEKRYENGKALFLPMRENTQEHFILYEVVIPSLAQMVGTIKSVV